jgi:hypothetical protein
VDVDKMLTELRMEREQIEEAILTLERLARGRGRRRGRPPAWLKDAQTAIAEEVAKDESGQAAPKRRGRPVGSGKLKQAAAFGSEVH